MTQKIYKYQICSDFQFLTITGFQKILSVKKQHGGAVLYVIVDTESNAVTNITIRSFWTGQEMFAMEDFDYLDSILFDNDDYVVHYFVKVV
jgi:hypothetical protein